MKKLKYKFKEKELSCEDFKPIGKEGQVAVCTCKMSQRGSRKNLRMYFKLTKDMK